MLDVSLHSVSNFALAEVTLTFPAGTHTAVIGPPASGLSTLLRLVAGTLRPAAGEIRIGTRVVNDLSASRRPLLYVTSSIDAPERWSVRHALVAAVRRRTLDRADRQHEYALAVDQWKLDGVLDRKIGSLSGSERTRAHLARIELLRPAVLVADRLLEHLNPSSANELIDTFYRTLRVAGTTVITAPATRAELGATDRVIVLERGRMVQEGTAAHIYLHPASEASALATGEVNVVPIEIRDSTVGSVIGSWDLAAAPFQGPGVALARPEAFALAAPGGPSDLIVAVEEATFENGRWMVRAILTGVLTLRISLDADVRLHKGKLLALTYEPSRFVLVAREGAGEHRGTTFAPPGFDFDDNRRQR